MASIKGGQSEIFVGRSGNAAIAELTISGLAIADETVVIDGATYTWKAAPSAAYEVDIGADADGCRDNLIAAINSSGTPGTEYGAGTIAHPSFIASANGAGVVKVSHRLSGTEGNGKTMSETMTNGAWDGDSADGTIDHIREQVVLTVPANMEAVINHVALSGENYKNLMLSKGSDGTVLFRHSSTVTGEFSISGDQIAKTVDGGTDGDTIKAASYGAATPTKELDIVLGFLLYPSGVR